MLTSGAEDGRGARRRRGLRAAAAVAAGLTLVATAGSAIAWAGLNRLSGNIETIDVSASLGTARPSKPAAEGPTEPLNVLVMGTDTRTGQGTGFGDPGLTASGNGHSDTTLLVHISADRSRALAVSIPRDSWVSRPSCKGDGGTVTGRFNEAFAAGGPSCTIRAVEALTGVRVDHFVVVDFTGFKAVVDAVGGVPVCLAEPVDDPKSGLKLDAGRHRLDGDQALAFARARKTLGDGSDLSRIDRQQVFLGALVKEVASKDVLTDLPTLYGVLDAVTQSLTTDAELGSLEALKTLALSLQGLSPSAVKFITVPWVPRSDGATIEWDEAKAAPLWRAMVEDTPYPAPVTVPPGQKPLTAAPASVRVRVLNGTGVPGTARAAADQLRALGYVVVGVGDAPEPVAATTVRYDPRYDESARTLVWSTRATQTLATGSGRELVLTVGPDWQAPRAAIAKRPSATATSKTADDNPCVS